MTILEILILAIALSIDASIVSFSYGLAFKEKRLINALSIAIVTAFFQGLMPCIGYFLTSFIRTYINPYANWIVFVIFVLLGSKFIIEACRETKDKPLCLNIICLIVIGIATSIDAFSAGISLAIYENSLLYPALLIAIITFINSIIGFWLGGKLQKFPSKFLEIMAGVMLIGLGVNAIF